MHIDYKNVSDRVEVPISKGQLNDVQYSQDKNQTTTNILNSLREGDTFSGTIVENKDKTVLVAIDGSDAYISASICGTQEFEENQKVIFRVVENKDGKVLIKPFSQDIISDELAKKSLLSQGIPVNDKNIAIAKELINNNLKLSKENILAISRAMGNIPDAKLTDLVKMLKYNVSLSIENYTMYNNYKENSQNIDKDLNNLVNSLKEMFTSNRNEFVKLLLDITNIDNVLNNKDINQNENILDNKDANAIGKDITNMFKNEASIDSDIESIPSKTLINEETLAKNSNLNNGIDDQSNDTTNKDISQLIKDSENNLAKSEDLPKSQQLDIAKKDTVEQLFDDTLDLTQLNNDKLVDSNNDINYDNVNNSITNLLSDEEIDVILNSMKQQLNDNSITKDNISLEHILKFPFKDDETKHIVKKLVTNILKESFLATPKDLSEDKVNEYFKKTMEKLDLISEFADKYSKEPEQVMKFVSAIKENVNFMNEMNTTMQFFQIPININGKEHQAELYVYKNKKNINNDKEEKTAFIRLDMENLGNVDVFVKLFGTNVNMKFFVTNEEAKDILKDNMDLLTNKLDALGYVSKSEFIKSDKEWNFEDDFVKKNEPFIMLKKTGFDVRA